MVDNNASAATSSHPHPQATHQAFRRIDGTQRDSAYAAFLELTYDAVAGIQTCLEIVHASNLQREINASEEGADMQAPAIGPFDAEKLMRLSIASSTMLSNETMRRIELENQAG